MSCPFLDNDVLVFLFILFFFTLLWSNVLSARQICFGPISLIVMATGTTAVTAPVIPYLFTLITASPPAVMLINITGRILQIEENTFNNELQHQ